MEKGWVKVYTINQEYLAEILKQVLNDNAIECVLINKMDSSYQNFGSIEVYVHHSKVIMAKKLIEEFEKADRS